jgi:hypothetical protein
MRQAEIQFIRSLGFTTIEPDHRLYVALMFQPRTVASTVALGIALQSAWVFLALAALLWLGTVAPTMNAFDAAYKWVVAYWRGLPSIPIAPAPRRFAQAMAGTMALAIGSALLAGASLTAWILQALFMTAATSVVVGRACPPANLYLRLTGSLAPVARA